MSHTEPLAQPPAPPRPEPFAPPGPLERRARLARYWTTMAAHHLPPLRGRSVFVLGAPRTGTSWCCRILSHYLDLPLFMPRVYRWPLLRPAVLHLHRFLVVPERTIYMLRDPRDAAVSYYHKTINTMPPAVIERVSRYCPQPLAHENVRENLPGFIRYICENPHGGSAPYPAHVRRALDMGLYRVRYEDLLEATAETLSAMVRRLTGAEPDPARVAATVAATSFEARTGRKRGEEDLGWGSVRKGIAGDWRNHFTPESARVLQRHAGGLLTELGYERDEGWVESLEAAP